jgi:hypothetical protein
VKATSFLVLAAALLLAISATGCDWIRSIALFDSMQVEYKSPKLTLAWDPPPSDIPDLPTEVIRYQIYCREHGTSGWRFLGELPAASHPEYTVEHSQLGDGLFDFAVRDITKDGRASPLHTSLDSNADPVSGWYVLWVQSY